VTTEQGSNGQGSGLAASSLAERAAPLIQGLLGVAGLRSATLYRGSGEVLALASQPGRQTDLALAPAALAIISALEGTLGGSWQDLVLDLDTGAVLLQPISANNLAVMAPLGVLMLDFDDLAGLGRMRFAARRLHTQLQTLLSEE
jgi:hypothetical protein